MELIHKSHLSSEENLQVNAGFSEYNATKGHADSKIPVAFVAYDEAGCLIGALDGYIFYSWLTIGRLWVKEDSRNIGVGSDLLQKAEEEARKKNCVGSTLSTYEFQARIFYEKMGYQVFGQLENNPVGYSRSFMKKNLKELPK